MPGLLLVSARAFLRLQVSLVSEIDTGKGSDLIEKYHPERSHSQLYRKRRSRRTCILLAALSARSAH